MEPNSRWPTATVDSTMRWRGTVYSMPRPKQHFSTNRRPCRGFIRAIYTRRTDDTGRIRWESLGWLCDTCHKWAESEWELTG